MVPSTLHHDVEEAARTLERAVRTMTPGTIDGDQAHELVALLGRAERAVASGMALLTPVVIAERAFIKSGHSSGADWLGSVTGTSKGTAKGRLAAAEQATHIPELADALLDGKLSTAQLKIVTDTTAVAPQAPGPLLALVAQGATNRTLSEEAIRQRRAGAKIEDERARRKKVHAKRYFRWYQCADGGIRGDFYCDEVAWAKVRPALEADAKSLWKAAGAAPGVPLDAYRLDAFLELLAHTGSKRSGARNRAIVVIDAEALRRGTTEGDELCEIEGIGPVSVEAATELIGDAGLQFVIKDGIDIRTVTGTTRAIAQRIDVALLVRDRKCVVPICGNTRDLERDHCQIDFKDGGPTELANLARLCPTCHDLKSQGHCVLRGGPGNWSWEPPAKGRMDRIRKVAAAKTKAKRNRPLRD